MGKKLSLLVAPTVVFLLVAFDFSAGLAANYYYSEQIDFTETFVPMTGHSWDQDEIESCIYREDGVDNVYYVWTKLSVQKWRQALQDYTGNQEGWNITARSVKSQAELESCDIKVYIYDKYNHFPDYPAQTGAYTSVKFRDGNDNNNNNNNNLDVQIYLSLLGTTWRRQD